MQRRRATPPPIVRVASTRDAPDDRSSFRRQPTDSASCRSKATASGKRCSSPPYPARGAPGSRSVRADAGRSTSRGSRSSCCPSSRSTSSPRSRSNTRRTSSPSATRRSTSSTRSARSSAARSSLDEATKTILTEVSETVGARRAIGARRTTARRTRCAPSPRSASIWRDVPADRGRRPVQRQRARVPHAASRCSLEGDEMLCPEEASYRRGAMLSVPIMWTAPVPRGAEPLGVVNLSDRRSGQPFTAGDQKLIAAIATQIGTAIQNTRLVRASVEQQRLVARDAARARPADEAAARTTRSSRRRPTSRRASFPPRASAATSTICSASAIAHGRDDRRRLRPRLPGRADHGARP